MTQMGHGIEPRAVETMAASGLASLGSDASSQFRFCGRSSSPSRPSYVAPRGVLGVDDPNALQTHTCQQQRITPRTAPSGLVTALGGAVPTRPRIMEA